MSQYNCKSRRTVLSASIIYSYTYITKERFPIPYQTVQYKVRIQTDQPIRSSLLVVGTIL